MFKPMRTRFFVGHHFFHVGVEKQSLQKKGSSKKLQSPQPQVTTGTSRASRKDQFLHVGSLCPNLRVLRSDSIQPLVEGQVLRSPSVVKTHKPPSELLELLNLDFHHKIPHISQHRTGFLICEMNPAKSVSNDAQDL